MDIAENRIAKQIVDAAFYIYSKSGPGLLEMAYEIILMHELSKRGLPVERQVDVPIRWDGVRLDRGFIADLVVEGLVIVELKSVPEITKMHGKQLLTQLKLPGPRLGLIINFGGESFKGNVKRVSNGLPKPPPSELPDLTL